MRPKSEELKQKLKKITLLKDKVDLLKDTYKDEECYILTAGPSMKDYDAVYIKEKLKDKLVIAVKQTYNIAPDIVDFHILNPFNYQPYKYKENEPIVMMVHLSDSTMKTPGSFEDLRFYINSKDATKEGSLAYTLNYENYLLDKNLERPFGPGIIHELGIYLPILLGVKVINIIGWDLGDSNTNEIRRFYESNKFSKKIQKQIMDLSPNLYNKIYVRIINRINYYRFLLGANVVLNNPGISEGEATFIAKSTIELYTWLRSKGIELNIISRNSMVDKIVPRIEL